MKKIVSLLLVLAMMMALCTLTALADDTIIVATNPEYPPFEYVEGEEVVGYDLDLWAAIAEKAGLTYEIESMDFDAVISSVAANPNTIGLSGISITDERLLTVDFSNGYINAGLVVIVKADSGYTTAEQLKGKKIGVQGGTTSETFVLEQLKQEPERSKSPAEAVAALKSGRVEFVIADIDPAKNCVKGEADLALSDFITSEEYAVAIRKGQPELLKAIDETIAELKASGQLDQWIRQFTEESDKLKDE